MGKLNQDFRYHRAFDFITLIVFILFLAFFAKSIITIIGAFGTEVYTNTMAELGGKRL
jgi:ABC-type multidrug transport system permease subunit